jgi:hypothetical protein
MKNAGFATHKSEIPIPVKRFRLNSVPKAGGMRTGSEKCGYKVNPNLRKRFDFRHDLCKRVQAS